MLVLEHLDSIKLGYASCSTLHIHKYSIPYLCVYLFHNSVIVNLFAKIEFAVTDVF